MQLVVEGLDVWAASLKDKPGGLAEKLGALKDAGADLEFIIARRSPDKPGSGVVFVTPLRDDKEISAAAEAGFNVTRGVHAVRVEGVDTPGVAADLTQKIAEKGVSLRGFSAAVIGSRFIAYLAVDSLGDRQKVVEILRKRDT